MIVIVVFVRWFREQQIIKTRQTKELLGRHGWPGRLADLASFPPSLRRAHT